MVSHEHPQLADRKASYLAGRQSMSDGRVPTPWRVACVISVPCSCSHTHKLHTHHTQVASGRYVAVEAPRTPLTLAQTKLNASAVIQTGSPIRRWRSKEGLQDVEWDEFADLVGVVRCRSQNAPYQAQPLVSDVLLPPHPFPPLFPPVLHKSSH